MMRDRVAGLTDEVRVMLEDVDQVRLDAFMWIQ
jgi:hypothetical protein